MSDTDGNAVEPFKLPALPPTPSFSHLPVLYDELPSTIPSDFPCAIALAKVVLCTLDSLIPLPRTDLEQLFSRTVVDPVRRSSESTGPSNSSRSLIPEAQVGGPSSMNAHTSPSSHPIQNAARRTPPLNFSSSGHETGIYMHRAQTSSSRTPVTNVYNINTSNTFNNSGNTTTKTTENSHNNLELGDGE
ncbi:hypothetical protein H0H92_003920, partial [Tricholoma furcatifolium]